MVPNPYLSIELLLGFVDLLIVQMWVVALIMLLFIWAFLTLFVVPAVTWEVLLFLFVLLTNTCTRTCAKVVA